VHVNGREHVGVGSSHAPNCDRRVKRADVTCDILTTLPRNIIISSLLFKFSLAEKIYKKKISVISIN